VVCIGTGKVIAALLNAVAPTFFIFGADSRTSPGAASLAIDALFFFIFDDNFFDDEHNSQRRIRAAAVNGAAEGLRLPVLAVCRNAIDQAWADSQYAG